MSGFSKIDSIWQKLYGTNRQYQQTDAPILDFANAFNFECQFNEKKCF